MFKKLHTFTIAACMIMAAAPPALGQSQEMECPIRIDFTMEDAADYWQTVNDGVMGGRSSGGSRFEDGYLVFEGNINTNGGGFSSIRARMERGALSDTDALKMKVRSDGRAYKITLRTGATFRGRSVAFQAELPETPKGQWADIEIPYTDLEASIFGRPVSGAQFNKSDAGLIGFILSDGQDGPFRLDVEWVEAC